MEPFSCCGCGAPSPNGVKPCDCPTLVGARNGANGKREYAFLNEAPRRHHGECQRCQRVDYLPWATERGERYCGHCFEKDALSYAHSAGWMPPSPPSSETPDKSETKTSISKGFLAVAS